MPLARDANNQVAQAAGLGPSQNVTITAVSAQSTAMSDDRVFAVRLCATADCWVVIGTNPTATTSSTLLPAGAVEYFRIRKGQKVAVIGTSGTLNLTEAV